jgi:hypothetical protein
MPQASNVEVESINGGVLSIVGTVDKKDKKVALLHVWLAQPGGSGQAGAGLAIDCLADGDPFHKDEFRVQANPGTGFVGKFYEGPATASAIAVLTNGTAVTEVLEWSRILTLPADPGSVDVPASETGQGGSA